MNAIEQTLRARNVAIAACVIVAGCAQVAGGLGSLPAQQRAAGASIESPRAATFQTIYHFRGTPDAENPEAGVFARDGTFYGVTRTGGRFRVGAVYAVTPSGTERIVHSFEKFSEGIEPYTDLIAVGGKLYGNTTGGGNAHCTVVGYAAGCGTVFELDPSGALHVLYRFKGGQDGTTPQAALTLMNGKLYGMAAFGGDSHCYEGCGVVYEIGLSGGYRVVYRFTGRADGSGPTDSLVAYKGVLYGTAFTGGAKNKGVVFALTPAGKERVLYSFPDGAGGTNPWANITIVDGVLYGSTLLGDGTGCYRHEGCGTIFSLTTSGHLRVLHRFGTGADGGNPIAGLVYANHTLYGAAEDGGNPACTTPFGPGCGTLFTISTSGKYSVVHRFSGGDGAGPFGNLVPLDGALYGTTFIGGLNNNGTVFKFRL